MYKPVKVAGDSVAVPQLVFAKLGVVGGTGDKKEGLFQVALYVLQAQGASADDVAKALRMPKAKAEAALNYWEGAGLIYQEEPPMMEDVAGFEPKKRKKLTTKEVVQASDENKNLRVMIDELQRLFGMVIGQSDINAYVSLCVQDKFSMDLVLLAASEALANGAKNAKYVEKILNTWKDNGINNAADADSFLKLQSQRMLRLEALAKHLGMSAEAFSLADKKKVAIWFEEYEYGYDMIDAARLVAGDKSDDIRYINGILKRWKTKGYEKPQDLSQRGEARNVRISRKEVPNKKDMLGTVLDYVPMKRGENG